MSILKTRNFKYDVFLSCAGEDKINVKEFYNKLHQYGAKVFYYDVLEDGAYGTNPNNFLIDVLKNSQHLIFYWTRNSNKEWTNKEVKYFDENCKNGKNREIIVYHDIAGKKDYTTLPENLKDDYYREVDFAELLKRIGANSEYYMEKRYFRFSEFLKKPEKKLDIEIKVGIGCCIWAAPIIRKIMDDGGISNAKITFFDKYQFQKVKPASLNGKADTKEKYELKRGPYFYSRNNTSQSLLTIPPYLKGSKTSKKKFSTFFSEKIKQWPPYFNRPDLEQINKYFNDILTERFERCTIYQVPAAVSGEVTPVKDILLFMENTIEGLFLRMSPDKLDKTYFNNILNIFFHPEVKNIDDFQKVFKRKINDNNGTKFIEDNFVKNNFNLEQTYLNRMFSNFFENLFENIDPGLKEKIGEDLKQFDSNYKSYLEKKIIDLEKLNKETDIELAKLLNELNTQFPLLCKTFSNIKLDTSQINLVRSGMYEWYKVLIGLYKILSITSVNYINNYDNDFSKEEGYKVLEDTISSILSESENENTKVNVKLYPDNKEQLLLVLDNEFENKKQLKVKGKHPLLGQTNNEALSKLKDKFEDKVNFNFYDEIGNTKLYTAKDIVGLIHEESLDCIIVPSEVYYQEHEKGKNRNVLTKIASIMYTVAGGCDFLFVSKEKDNKDIFEEFIRKTKKEQAENNNAEFEERKILGLFKKLKKETNYEEIKILYTSNTVSKKYHEKYFSSPDIIHEPVDVGNWKKLKEKIENIIEKEERLIILGWQPQISWIQEYFNDRYYICDENLMLLEGSEDLPYLSYDIMLRTNVLDTWFRSFAFESFLTTIKDSIEELNKSMQSQIDTVDTPVEVEKIATFLNMNKKICKQYLKKINFEFRYDAEYTKLYENYIKRMNDEY